MSHCGSCGGEKTPETCSLNHRYSDGYMSWCKACTAESSRRSLGRKTPEQRKEALARRREGWAANREELRAKKRAWRAERVTLQREKDRDYYARNAQSCRDRVRRYAERHPDVIRDRNRRWDAQNHEHRLRLNSRRRARLVDAYVEDVDRLVVLERDDGECGVCGGDVDPLDFHVDHIVPLVRGGLHNYENAQPAHPRCNVRKHTKLMEEMV